MILFRAGPIQQATYAEAELPEEGFAFNINGKPSPTFFAPFTAATDRVQGTLVIGILSFIPANMVRGYRAAQPIFASIAQQWKLILNKRCTRLTTVVP
ncbi:hypothetical protein [Ferruginibacter sp.]|uniref:hypothetical protein n=1 Tax=Ferruginibacter sp. TaxID=1940288 RepID=UPI00265A4B87|nr:hypothetical protein [Ferruginibacter sp.]